MQTAPTARNHHCCVRMVIAKPAIAAVESGDLDPEDVEVQIAHGRTNHRGDELQHLQGAHGHDIDVTVGVLSPGDLNDNGYYESFVVKAQAFVDEQDGWELITVGEVEPWSAEIPRLYDVEVSTDAETVRLRVLP